jgi:uncharacterized protein involved in outer membrane biogenesis
MLLDLAKKLYLAPIFLFIRLGLWVLGFVLMAGVLFLLTFDLNDYKGEIEKRASAFLQGEMKINGDVNLGVENFRPSLVLYDVKIGEDGRTTIMLADRLEVVIPLAIPDGKDPWSFFAEIQNLQINGRRLGDHDIPIRFRRDGFEMNGIEGKLDDARLTGNVSYLSGVFHVDLNIKDLDYSHVAEGIEGGETKVDILLDGKGQDLDQIKRSLKGHIDLAGEAGELAGNALNLWAGDLLTSVLRGPQKETKINCAIADFVVENGVAKSRTIIFDTDQVTVFAKGSVDLAAERVNILFTPKPKKASLVSLATPVRVSVPFGQIHSEPETEAALKKIGGLLLGAVNPAIAMMSLMESGAGGKNPCIRAAQSK